MKKIYAFLFIYYITSPLVAQQFCNEYTSTFITVWGFLKYYHPDGKETQRIGIVPDIEVKPTIDGIRAGLDEVFERAKNLINQKSPSSPIKAAF